MSNERRASAGAIGGASGEAGSAYRAGVVAYTVTCGLSGTPIDGLGIPSSDAQVSSVALETDAPIDDIRVRFTSGWIADIQAKRTLKRGPTLNAAVAQWVIAAQAGLDHTCQRLVIVTSRLNGPMRQLRDALDRRRLPISGAPTGEEVAALSSVESQMSDLSDEQCARVLDVAVIWEMDVVDLHAQGTRETLMRLDRVGLSIHTDQAHRAWDRLRTTALTLARQRGGYELSDWLADLRAAGLSIDQSLDHPAGQLETRRAAIERYADRLIREASTLDLRALSANLPIIDLANADAGVRVGLEGDRTASGRELLWAFLRRRQVVLTGLPGGGKSTAVRKVAGQLAAALRAHVRGERTDDDAYPFPVRVSLRDVNVIGDGTSFRDRLIATAVSEDPAADRNILRTEIEHRLDNGLPIALMLDALDETYDDRATVVSQLESFLTGLPDASFVIIATRDIAYPQAATLGWAEVRMLSPDDIPALVTAVLDTAAAHLKVQTEQIDEWVATRAGWVSRALTHAVGLAETPLIPTLLAVLAAGRNVDELPTRRALVLHEVVTDLMKRHEMPRHQPRGLGQLHGDDAVSAAMATFATEARTILDSNGVASFASIQKAVTTTLHEQWGLSSGAARVAADSAIKFLDETGVFVLNAHDKSASARLSLFAEIGDAMYAIEDPSGNAGWLRRRIDGRQLEPIALAAAMDDSINAAWQAELSTSTNDLGLARAMVQLRSEGGTLTAETEDTLRRIFIESLGQGTTDGWSDCDRLRTLGIPDALAETVLAAASTHSPEHLLLVKAELALARNADHPGAADDGLLLALLGLSNLPRSARQPREKYSLTDLMIDTGLSRAHQDAAKVLLERQTPGAVEAIVNQVRNTSSSSHDELVKLLKGHGHNDAVRQLEDDEREALGGMPAWMMDTDPGRYERFMALVADGERGPLSTTQRVQQTELADFLETLDLNNGGAGVLYKQDETYLRALIDLTSTLFGFDRQTIAAQAQITLERMSSGDSHNSYFSLFDHARGRVKTKWATLTDPQSAVDIIIPLFTMAPAQGRVAALCLWASAEAAPFAEPQLAQLVPHLDRHPRHQHWVAVALATLPTTPSPAAWHNDSNPVLRTISVYEVEAVRDDGLTQEFQALLNDPDGHVRQTAIRQLRKYDGLSARESVLQKAAREARPGWRCLHCAHDNPPGRSSCEGRTNRKRDSECGTVGPEPAATAKAMLKEFYEKGI